VAVVFVPAGSMVNCDEKVDCPDLSSRRRMYVPDGVVAYGLHSRNEFVMPTKMHLCQSHLTYFIWVV
jgi:hypothetical protein